MKSEKNIFFDVWQDYLYLCQITFEGWNVYFKNRMLNKPVKDLAMGLDAINFEDEYLKRPGESTIGRWRNGHP